MRSGKIANFERRTFLALNDSCGVVYRRAGSGSYQHALQALSPPPQKEIDQLIRDIAICGRTGSLPSYWASRY